MKRYDLPDADVFAARAGDRAAQARVFASVERLCWWVASKYRRQLPPSFPIEDAVQDCRIGVLNAIRKFDPSKGSFGTYASVWMRARLELSIEREKAGAAPKAMDAQITRYKVHKTVQLDRALGVDEPAPIDVLVEPSPRADEVLLDEERRALVQRNIKRLPEKERRVVQDRLAGLMLHETGGEMGVSRARVFQIHQQAAARLRRRIRAANPEMAA